MDAPSPPPSPPPGEAMEIESTTTTSTNARIEYKDRVFNLTDSEIFRFQISNRPGINHRDLQRLKQKMHSSVSVHDHLMVKLIWREGNLHRTDGDRSLAKNLVVRSGIQLARRAARVGLWLAARAFLKVVYDSMYTITDRVDRMLGRIINRPMTWPTIRYQNDEASTVIQLARKTQEMRLWISYVRQGTAMPPELQKPPRLLHWRLQRDDRGDPVFRLTTAMTVMVNAMLVQTWSGGATREATQIRVLTRLVTQYGRGEERDALVTAASYRKIYWAWIDQYSQSPDRGPRGMGIEEGEETENLRLPNAAVRYSLGKLRDADKDARNAERMSMENPVLYRMAMASELTAHQFDQNITHRYYPDEVKGQGRGIRLTPYLTPGMEMAMRSASKDAGILLRIPSANLVGLGYYDIDALSPVTGDITDTEHYDEWYQQAYEHAIDEEGGNMKFDVAEDLLEEEIQEKGNDPAWIAAAMDVAYFIFYDDVAYSAYLSTIRDFGYFTTNGKLHWVPRQKRGEKRGRTDQGDIVKEMEVDL